MKDYSKSIRIPTKEEAEEIQKRHPELKGMKPMSQEELDRCSARVKEIHAEEEEFPLLKPTQESLELFGARQELNRSKMEFIEKLERTPLKVAVQDWLQTFRNRETAKNYAYYMSDMMARKIVSEYDRRGNVVDVGEFNHFPHERMIDYIKRVEDWSEGTRQVRAACYISFTSYLSRLTQGWFRKAEPSKLTANPTFFQERDKCKTEALTALGAKTFIDKLEELNVRDSLVAKAMLQGAKRISEVLALEINQIDFTKNMIRYRQLKTGGIIKEIPITYPPHFMNELKEYIEESQEHRGDSETVFITRNGKPLTRTRLNHSFEETSKRLGWRFYDERNKCWKGIKVTPHVMRATWVTFAKQQGVSDTDIMAVTGHTSSKMVFAYDKTSAEENLTKKLSLI